MFRLKTTVHLLSWRSPYSGGIKFVGWDSKKKIYSTRFYENVGFGKITTWVKTRKEITNKIRELESKGYCETVYLRELKFDHSPEISDGLNNKRFHLHGHVHDER